ncbi:MAG: hypothetical protein Q8920_03505 [Bacillota bacterium]|nr:hypothetical protein [Bacillota bacterium]
MKKSTGIIVLIIGAAAAIIGFVKTNSAGYKYRSALNTLAGNSSISAETLLVIAGIILVIIGIILTARKDKNR